MRNTNVFYLWIFILLLFSCNDSGKKGPFESRDTSVIAEKANYYFQQKEYFKAKLLYDTLILIDSSKGEYYFKRGYSKSMLLNDDNGAIVDYFKSINHNYQKKQSAYLNIGVLYTSKGSYDSALYFYDECLKLDSGNSKAIKGKEELDKILNNLK